jgi:hypothetical protein
MWIVIEENMGVEEGGVAITTVSIVDHVILRYVVYYT